MRRDGTSPVVTVLFIPCYRGVINALLPRMCLVAREVRLVVSLYRRACKIKTNEESISRRGSSQTRGKAGK